VAAESGDHGATTGAEAAAGHGGEAAAQAGLPQLDPSYFASQLFWLTLFFVALYLFLSRVMLPKLGGVIEARETKRANDIDAAAKANAEAQAALKSYEQSLAGAAAEARKLADAARAEANTLRSARMADQDKLLDERLSAAEIRVAAARAEGLVAAKTAAAEAAEAIVEKIAGLKAA
jgi:F-type H+-transporting ATPase subunit b